jgi:hypothetical protein
MDLVVRDWMDGIGLRLRFKSYQAKEEYCVLTSITHSLRLEHKRYMETFIIQIETIRVAVIQWFSKCHKNTNLIWLHITF